MNVWLNIFGLSGKYSFLSFQKLFFCCFLTVDIWLNLFSFWCKTTSYTPVYNLIEMKMTILVILHFIKKLSCISLLLVSGFFILAAPQSHNAHGLSWFGYGLSRFCGVWWSQWGVSMRWNDDFFPFLSLAYYKVRSSWCQISDTNEHGYWGAV